MKRYFARADEPLLSDVLARAGEPLGAIAEGRVFAGEKRATRADEPVKSGDVIVVQPRGEDVPGVVVLSEFRDLYAVFKPAGLSTEPDRRGAASLVVSLSKLLGAPPSVLHAATRLDTPVSGIVVVARGFDAARRAARLKDEGNLRRRYVALAAGRLPVDAGVWNVPIGTGPRGRPVANGRDARASETRFQVLWSRDGSAQPMTALRLEPITGRSHQLRVHAAHAGAPLYGDGQRGGPSRLVAADGAVLGIERLALHAGRIDAVETDTTWSVLSPVPAELEALLAAAGGNPGVLSDALTAAPLDEDGRS